MDNYISKNILALCYMGLVCFMGSAQDTPEFPTVAPPTPTAAALHSFGNNSVSYYSGTVDVSIPLFTIQEGDIEVPIVLNYTGGSGIKVEEQGSWVGLGWSLNAGGAVSRTKRGVADEAGDGRGFMSYSSVPAEETDGNGNLLNADFIADIAQGRKDSEPDRFMYNIPSGSGSFFIDFNSIVQKPFTDKLITYSSGSGNYNDPINTNNCDATSGLLEAFHITDEQGLYYTFEEKERSNSRNVLGDIFDYNCYPTSWQLTKIEDNNSDLTVDFEYDAYYYSNIRLNPLVTGLNETETYVEDSFLAKPLKKINFSNGSVEFILATTTRKDMDGAYALDKIIIKDENNDTIRKFHFNYKYLTANALVDDSGALSVSNANRMVLSSLQEVGTNGETLPPYNFTYNTSVYLPNTFSKAKDHWGYYNGKNTNAKFQAKQLARWYNGADSNVGWVTTLIGSANREPNPTYAQAGILQRVQYPTGGYTDYEYEGNEAVDAKLQAALVTENESLDPTQPVVNIDVDLHTAGATHTVMTINALQYPSGCYPIVHFENTSTNAQVDYSFENETSGLGGQVLDTIVAAGNYDVSFSIHSSTVSCDPNFDNVILLNWENESSTPTKAVGGVRIKKITDHPLHGPSLSRTFDYLADDGESSGGVVSTPRYWFQNYTIDTQTQSLLPLSLENRSAASQYPLINTGSNVVGYSKVTVTQHDGSNGKSEFYFTSPEDFPDKKMGYVQYNGERDDFDYGGTIIETYPVVTENSREYLRGKLLKQIDYKYNGSVYDTIAYTENLYTAMAYDPDGPGLGPFGQQFSANKSLLVKGINIVPSGLGQTSNTIKEYEIHSGYIQLEKTVSKSYFDTGTVETTTLNKYPEDLDGAITYKMPIENEVVDSWGEKSITKSFYVFNSLDNTERDIGQDLITGTMASRNMVYAPTHSFSYRQEGTSPEERISQQQTLYAQDGNGIILPQKIKTAKLANSLEDRLEFVSYDNRKNPLEIHRTDGPSTSFVWGYNGTKVIAKLDNVEMESTTLTTAQSNAISAAVTASDGDVNTTTEDTLRQELEDLRAAFPTAMVTTFTYDLMVGVTSVTDPRGYTTYYEYDEFNRLKEVKDDEGNIVEDIKYHYQGQQ